MGYLENLRWELVLTATLSLVGDRAPAIWGPRPWDLQSQSLVMGERLLTAGFWVCWLVECPTGPRLIVVIGGTVMPATIAILNCPRVSLLATTVSTSINHATAWNNTVDLTSTARVFGDVDLTHCAVLVSGYCNYRYVGVEKERVKDLSESRDEASTVDAGLNTLA